MRYPLLFLAAAFAASPVLGQDAAKQGTVTPAYPKDHPAETFHELKVYDAAHNPVRVPKENWTGAAAKVASDPEWGKWLVHEKQVQDEWMQTQHEHPEWNTGWFHNFVSPKDGSMLTWTPEEPGPDKPLHSASDPSVENTPKLHGAWVFFFRSSWANRMLAAARLFRLTGDKKYAEWAATGLDFYAENFLKWPMDAPEHLGRNNTRIMGQPLDEAVNLIRYVQTARTLGDYATPERKKNWIDHLFKPDAELLLTSTLIIHNIACWQHSAVGEVALYTQDEDLWRKAVSAPLGIHEQVARGITSDYLWYEQSLHYNEYVVQALSPFFSDAQMAGRGKELQEDMASVENLMLAPAAMRFPSGQLPNPADGGKAEFAPSHAFWRDVSPLFPTQIGVYELAHERSWAALLDPPDPSTVPAQLPKLPPVVSRNFETSRMAIICGGPWQAYFHYGQLTSSHSQSEALNYEAFFKDTEVTHDAGTTGYGSAMHKGYYAVGVCHNVPLVDGMGQKDWNRGKFESFTATSVAASQPEYLPGARASRALAIDGNALKDTANVTTTDGKPHALGFVLHFEGKAEALPTNFAPEPNPEGISPGPGFKYWKSASKATFHDKASFKVRCGTTALQATFEMPGEFTVYHAVAPDLLPKVRDVFYVQCQGKEATLKTTIQPVQ